MPRSAHLDPRLAHVLAQLTEFRQTRRPGTHIPTHLRQLVLDAAAGGISLSAISKQLGISADQVLKWRGGRDDRALALVAPPSPRILNIVSPKKDDQPAPTGLRVTYEAGRFVLEFSL